MVKLIPATGFLYLRDSSLDMYLGQIKEAVNSIPETMLKMEPECKPIITDFSRPNRTDKFEIEISYGYPEKIYNDKMYPKGGLVFCIESGCFPNVSNIRMHISREEYEHDNIMSEFTIGNNTFIITGREFDLDRAVLTDLYTGNRYNPLNK